jgi:uncharacterized protein YkwD
VRPLLEQEVLDNVNVLRRQHHLVPLRMSARLVAAAREHSNDMATLGYFSHSSLNGVSYNRRIARFYPRKGYRQWWVGENLVFSFAEPDAADLVDQWLHSEAHRKVMLTPRWRQLGVGAVHADSAPGVYGGREVTVITADFGVRR